MTVDRLEEERKLKVAFRRDTAARRKPSAKSDVRKSKDIVFKYYFSDGESHTYRKKKKLLNVLNF